MLLVILIQSIIFYSLSKTRSIVMPQYKSGLKANYKQEELYQLPSVLNFNMACLLRQH